MKALRLVWRLAAYKPGLFWANCLIWTLFHSAPIAVGLIMRAFFDALTDGADAGANVWTILALLCGVHIARICIQTTGHWTAFSQELISCALLRRNMLEWVMQGPGHQSLPKTSGEAISRFRGDVRDSVLYLERATDVIGRGTFAIVAFSVMFRIAPTITLAVLFPVLVVAWITVHLSTRIRELRNANRRTSAKVTSIIGEISEAVQAIKVAAVERPVLAHFVHLNEARRRAAIKDVVLGEVLNSVNANMMSIGVGIVLIMTAGSIRDGQFSVGDFALFATYMPFLSGAMSLVGQLLAQHPRTMVGLQRMEAIVKDAPPDTLTQYSDLHLNGNFPPLPETPDNDHPLDTFEVKGLSYTYPNTHNGIHDVNLHVKSGSLTVIVGRIGSGKTTLLKCLLGVLPHDTGTLVWNGVQIDNPADFMVPPRSAYTAQVPVLFSDTLSNNIHMGHPVNAEEMDETMSLVVMEPDLAELDQGYDTVIGPRGVKLSGGQSLRTAAARMLVRNTELIVFDDLSSALDVDTEATMWSRLFERGPRTYLISSHRKPVLRRADHIIVMRNGRVEAEGKLNDLLDTCEEMQRLWRGEID